MHHIIVLILRTHHVLYSGARAGLSKHLTQPNVKLTCSSCTSLQGRSLFTLFSRKPTRAHTRTYRRSPSGSALHVRVVPEMHANEGIDHTSHRVDQEPLGTAVPTRKMSRELSPSTAATHLALLREGKRGGGQVGKAGERASEKEGDEKKKTSNPELSHLAAERI